MASKLTEIVVDCSNPDRLAAFWREALGYEEGERDSESVYIRPRQQGGLGILFARVPEGKTVKNRLHLDLRPTDRNQGEEVERLRSLGATEVDVGQGDVSWVVMADPEGNEFCVLQGQSN